MQQTTSAKFISNKIKRKAFILGVDPIVCMLIGETAEESIQKIYGGNTKSKLVQKNNNKHKHPRGRIRT